MICCILQYTLYMAAGWLATGTPRAETTRSGEGKGQAAPQELRQPGPAKVKGQSAPQELRQPGPAKVKGQSRGPTKKQFTTSLLQDIKLQICKIAR